MLRLVHFFRRILLDSCVSKVIHPSKDESLLLRPRQQSRNKTQASLKYTGSLGRTVLPNTNATVDFSSMEHDFPCGSGELWSALDILPNLAPNIVQTLSPSTTRHYSTKARQSTGGGRPHCCDFRETQNGRPVDLTRRIILASHVYPFNEPNPPTPSHTAAPLNSLSHHRRTAAQ